MDIVVQDVEEAPEQAPEPASEPVLPEPVLPKPVLPEPAPPPGRGRQKETPPARTQGH